MGDIGRVLNTARDAILSHITAINVTGSNIANINTPGYSRLRPTFGSVGVIDISAGQALLGVKITSIERLYDRYLEAQIVSQEQNVGYNKSRLDTLNRVENIFNESTGGGLNELLSKFWGAWGKLSANPSGDAERDDLLSISQSLASMFRQKANELIGIRNDANAILSDKVAELNTYIKDMVHLNNKIVQVEISGGGAPDMRDKRAELLRKISQIIDINYYEEANGALNIFMSNGRSLVEGSNHWELDVKVEPANSNYYDIVFKDTPDEVINKRIGGGNLAALIQVRDVTVNNYLRDVDEIAYALVDRVNTQHQSGYDLSGNIGREFFTMTSMRAKDMEVNHYIISNVRRIAASATVNGDGKNAGMINAIKDSLVMRDGTSTIDSFYQSVVARIGRDILDGKRGVDYQSAIMTRMETEREGISGVSMDEEMLNLIKYQVGYNAAGRLCGIISEMIDTLINVGK